MHQQTNIVQQQNESSEVYSESENSINFDTVNNVDACILRAF